MCQVASQTESDPVRGHNVNSFPCTSHAHVTIICVPSHAADESLLHVANSLLMISAKIHSTEGKKKQSYIEINHPHKGRQCPRLKQLLEQISNQDPFHAENQIN